MAIALYQRPRPAFRRPARAARLASVLGDDYIEALKGKILAIRQVMASGVSSAGYGDKRTEFRSLEQLREILNALEEELEGLLGYGGKMRQIRVTNQWDKGL